ncbi:MAG TPA: multifunctional CCA addition/repair protein [Tahibacter sp.]|uniref:multifunctional CCA addition/repair protein n=1 Tax=Tahibacter sp. TaxID=2056211 RepID=UPI002BA0F087|nr:multifunctional CCA addition/repair protein [Tahibacter sp.]HSX58595.1 multifunctional CCA addition/repair protein [Tahibacter sp.]
MEIYLVGGAVRDRLLGRLASDRDYVVVGATPEEMTARGFKPVGKDFPVFLHPQTGEEYALARTERKSGRGYAGFTFDTSAAVTLEDDLRRRDLTINAMAENESGRLVDPFDGARDLEARVLRHVSEAFVEDPVRLLRVARFAARYAPLGFTLAPETQALLRAMVDNGEVDHLVPERVWAELRRALTEPQPSAFLRILRECGALARLFPEIDALYGVPQRAEYHPEVDTGVHTEMVVDMAARLAPGDALIGWCALVHDLGKALTPADQLPRHVGHESGGVEPIRQLAARYRPPTEYVELAVLCCRQHLNAHRAFELRPATVVELFESLDGFRKKDRVEQFLLVCTADKRGRLGLNDAPYPQADWLRKAFAAAAAIEAKPFVERGIAGPAIGEAVRRARIAAVAALKPPDESRTG